MKREEREKNFNNYAERVSQMTVDYERQHKKFIEAAIHYECDPSEIRFPSEFYAHIEW